MSLQAPYEYIANYYDQVQKKNLRFPEVADFWLSGFRHVKGESVLNLGCGPMFYDNFLYFRDKLKNYVGLDLNEQSFEFLEKSQHPNLLFAKEKAQKQDMDMRFIKGSVFDHIGSLKNQFDTIVGVGFFATFEGEEFKNLLAGCHSMLKPDGRLLKMTWHGTQRTAEEQEDKIKYRYDNENEPAAHELIKRFENENFKTLDNEVLHCPPNLSLIHI